MNPLHKPSPDSDDRSSTPLAGLRRMTIRLYLAAGLALSLFSFCKNEAVREAKPATPAMKAPTTMAPPAPGARKPPAPVPETPAPKKITSVKPATPAPFVCPASITADHLATLPLSARGRRCLRHRLVKAGRFTRAVKTLGGLRLSHIYGDHPVYIEGKRYEFNKKRGRHYRVTAPRGRAEIVAGDRVTPFGRRDDLGFSTDDVRHIRKFYAFRILHRDDNVFNRTFPGRFKDHQDLIESITRHPNTPELKTLAAILNPGGKAKAVFFDIGPGIANIDLKEMGGRGIPAITSLEMARQFPQMPVILLDLPLQVDIFMGKTQGVTATKQKYTISKEKRNLLLGQPNIHILSGNGLMSLKDQLEDPKKNPLPDRRRPEIDAQTTVYIRAVNSIDIYCMFHRRNGRYPSLRFVFAKMALDFKKNPVLFMFNKILLLKRPGSKTWLIIGEVSDMGFDHNERELTRKGAPPFSFSEAFYHLILEQRPAAPAR